MEPLAGEEIPFALKWGMRGSLRAQMSLWSLGDSIGLGHQGGQGGRQHLEPYPKITLDMR